jgi:hypothetical protein
MFNDFENTNFFPNRSRKKFIHDSTTITIFFRRQAEKSLGLLRIKLQKLTFCKNAVHSLFIILLFIINCARVNKAENTDLVALKSLIYTNYLAQEAAKKNLVVSNTVLSDGQIETVINASNFDIVARYDFGTRAQTNDTIWDIGFERFKISTNSGATNSLGQSGACDTSSKTFASVVNASTCTTFLADAPNVQVNVGNNISGSQAATFGLPYTGSPVMRDWYDYKIGELTPTNKVYIVRSSDSFNYYKIQIRGYYNSAGTSGYITFWWKQIPF